MDVILVAWFTAVRFVVNTYINDFVADAFTRIAAQVGATSIGVITILIMIEGYGIAVGTSSQPAGAYVLKWLKIVMFTTVATSSGALNDVIQDYIVTVRDYIGFIAADIDPSDNLISTLPNDIYSVIIYKMAAVSILSSLSTAITSGVGSDYELSAIVTSIASSLGSGLPIITALMTSLSMELSLKFGIMLAPMCIFAGIFERTQDWPFIWAKYMLGVMLTTALMAVMTNVCIAVMLLYVTTSVGAYMLGSVSLVTISTFSAVVGLAMSMLLISVPAVAAKIIGGVAEGAASNQLGGDWNVLASKKSKK